MMEHPYFARFAPLFLTMTFYEELPKSSMKQVEYAAGLILAGLEELSRANLIYLYLEEEMIIVLDVKVSIIHRHLIVLYKFIKQHHPEGNLSDIVLEFYFEYRELFEQYVEDLFQYALYCEMIIPAEIQKYPDEIAYEGDPEHFYTTTDYLIDLMNYDEEIAKDGTDLAMFTLILLLLVSKILGGKIITPRNWDHQHPYIEELTTTLAFEVYNKIFHQVKQRAIANDLGVDIN